ncbi:DBH-like monooxygenase protein 1 [Haliotis rubra]|uniref:DBH-like monooxygenase protein 1 n=1 Tax=Haliotis rubra TaxID=36100 RepID=UPI001EE5DC51|nr:DBH-like monooxygenase protein 1 [Haliotis rubra]
MLVLRISTVLACVVVISGYAGYRDTIPNGYNLTHPCVTGELWPGVGHVNPAGGGERNQFGIDFANQGRNWANVCNMDSDGDGMTNGQELGDPQCIWTSGATPTRTTGLTHPGYCTPSSTQTCAGLATPSCESTEFDCPSIAESGVRSRDLRFPRTQVPSTETNYFCMTFDLDQSEDFHMIATKPDIDNVDVMHHILLYGCGDGAAEIPNPRSCGMATEDCNELIGLWTVGMNGQCLNTAAGFKLGRTGIKRVLLEYHWNNPEERSDFTDGTGFTIYYTPNLRQYDAGVFWTGQMHLDIPPGQSRAVYESTCPSECTNKFSDKIYITQGLNHMHYKGIAQMVEHFSNGERKYLTNDQEYSYDSPQVYEYNPPVTVNPGDSLKTTCVYQTLKETKTTTYGEATSDEMCFSFFTFYPKQSVGNPFCVGWKKIQQCAAQGGRLFGCDYRAFRNISNPETAMVVDKVLANCNPYGGCRYECPAAIAEAESHPCLANADVKDWSLTRMSHLDSKSLKFVAAMQSCSCENGNWMTTHSYPYSSAGTQAAVSLVTTVLSAVLYAVLA